jgi:hypothetical protein
VGFVVFVVVVVVVVVGYFLIFACNCCGSSAVMGVLVFPREWWSQKRKELENRGQRPPPAAATSFMIPAIIEQPLYPKQKQVLDNIAEEKMKRATKCTDGEFISWFFPLNSAFLLFCGYGSFCVSLGGGLKCFAGN